MYQFKRSKIQVTSIFKFTLLCEIKIIFWKTTFTGVMYNLNVTSFNLHKYKLFAISKTLIH